LNTIEIARWPGLCERAGQFYRVIGGGHDLPSVLNSWQVLQFFLDRARRTSTAATMVGNVNICYGKVQLASRARAWLVTS
jgi:hypothetical protein